MAGHERRAVASRDNRCGRAIRPHRGRRLMSAASIYINCCKWFNAAFGVGRCFIGMPLFPLLDRFF